jgi:hypothetical protein
MGAGQSCANISFSRNRLCDIGSCVKEAKGMASNSSSNTDVENDDETDDDDETDVDYHSTPPRSPYMDISPSTSPEDYDQAIDDMINW